MSQKLFLAYRTLNGKIAGSERKRNSSQSSIVLACWPLFASSSPTAAKQNYPVHFDTTSVGMWQSICWLGILVLLTESNAFADQQQNANEARTRQGSANNTETENEGNLSCSSQSGASQITRPESLTSRTDTCNFYSKFWYTSYSLTYQVQGPPLAYHKLRNNFFCPIIYAFKENYHCLLVSKHANWRQMTWVRQKQNKTFRTRF